jgi:hypothetical protein
MSLLIGLRIESSDSLLCNTAASEIDTTCLPIYSLRNPKTRLSLWDIRRSAWRKRNSIGLRIVSNTSGFLITSCSCYDRSERQCSPCFGTSGILSASSSSPISNGRRLLCTSDQDHSFSRYTRLFHSEYIQYGPCILDGQQKQI